MTTALETVKKTLESLNLSRDQLIPILQQILAEFSTGPVTPGLQPLFPIMRIGDLILESPPSLTSLPPTYDVSQSQILSRPDITEEPSTIINIADQLTYQPVPPRPPYLVLFDQTNPRVKTPRETLADRLFGPSSDKPDPRRQGLYIVLRRYFSEVKEDGVWKFIGVQ